MQAVQRKTSNNSQNFAVRTARVPSPANDTVDAEIIPIHQNLTRRAFPVLGTKVSEELSQMIFGVLDAVVLLLVSLMVLPVVGINEAGIIGYGVFVFVLFKAYLGGYATSKQG